MTVALPVLITSPTAWHTYWLVWIGIVFALFLPPEIYAAVVHNHMTLSETWWQWEHLDFKHRFDLSHWTILRYFMVAGFTWLYLHLCYGLVPS